MESNSVRILYDYYEQTCSLCRNAERRRNSLLIILLISVAAVLFCTLDPDGALKTITSWAHNQYGIDITLGSVVLQGIMWAAELLLLIRYVQITIYIERLYSNVHRAEDELRRKTKNNTISREGGDYLDNYPVVLTFIYVFYSFILPLVLLATIITAIIIETCQYGGCVRIMDAIFASANVAILVGFFIFRIKKDNS